MRSNAIIWFFKEYYYMLSIKIIVLPKVLEFFFLGKK